jgi:hypothetical protein
LNGKAAIFKQANLLSFDSPIYLNMFSPMPLRMMEFFQSRRGGADQAFRVVVQLEKDLSLRSR